MKKTIYPIIIFIILIFVLSSFLASDTEKNTHNNIETIDIKAGEKIYTHNKDIYTYGKSGIKIYNNKKLGLEDSFNLENPYVSSSYDKLAIGDKDGRVVRVYSNKEHLYTVNTANNILGFSVNKLGFLAIILNNNSFYNIELYNQSGDNIFSIKEIAYEEGMPVSLSISDNGEVLAVSHIKTDGVGINSKITLHSIKLGKLFGGVNKDGSFVSIVKFLDNNHLVGISDNEVFNISINAEKSPPKVTQTNTYEVNNIINHIKFLDGIGYSIHFGAPTTYKDVSIEKNFIRFYNTYGKKLGTYPLNNKDISNMWGNDSGIIILENRLFTAIDTSGKELWSYKATQDIKNIFFYNNKYIALIVTNNQIKILKMDKGLNKIMPPNIDNTTKPNDANKPINNNKSNKTETITTTKDKAKRE